VSLYLLDTNIVSYFLRARHPRLTDRLTSESPQALCLSAITEGELLYGLQKVGLPAKLTATTLSFLQTVSILPWDRDTAATYAKLKCEIQHQGLSLAPLDLMIASHALSVGAVLITNDSALKRLGHLLPVEDWSEPQA
jgi:tRNA(fMet)-specific endonuclease VapC